jgi:hypothetical protein
VKQTFLICLLLGCYASAFSQTGKITGSVIDADTKTSLELATVSILAQDSSLMAYQLSDKNGKFTIEKLPLKKNLLLSVTYTGYIIFNKQIQLEAGKTDTVSVFLALNNNNSNAVVVTATIPIRMNGDTLEINPAAFKMKQDAVVEELLNQVSGITIWSDGTITVNGKRVQNLLVDGKPFLGSTDSRVATQNLPKDAIDKIQLYQEYDRSKIGQATTPQDSLLTMNIKLKESHKKGYFGKAGAGYGTRERFESDFSFQTYNKRSNAGLGGGFNNINKNIGNLQEMFQNNTYRNYNPNLYNVGRFGAGGINKNHSVGGVYTHSFIETANSRQNNRLTLNYNKSGTDTYLSSLNLQNRTTIYNPQFIRDEGVQNMQQDKHDIGVNYLKTNSYNDNLSFNGTMNTNTERINSTNYTEVRDTANQLQSINNTTTAQRRRSDNESVNASYAKSNYEEPLKNFSIQLNARRSDGESGRDVETAFQSFTDPTKNTSNNRRYNTDNQTVNLGGSFDYAGFKRFLLGRYNLFGLDLRLTQSVNYTRVSDKTAVSDYDSINKRYIANGDLSNYNTREVFEYTPSLAMTKSFNKYSDVYSRNISLQARFLNEMKREDNGSSFKNRNLERSFRFPRYEGNASYYYTKREKYQYNTYLNYTKSYEYPSVDQLYTIVDDINVYDIRIGNPLLKNRISHLLYLSTSFNTQNPKSPYSVNSSISGNISRAHNAFTDSVINDRSGKRITYYTNADKSDNLSLSYNFNISRSLKKSKLQFTYRGQLTNGRSSNFVDGISNLSETNNISNQIGIQFTLRSLLVLNIDQNMQRYKTKQSAAGLKSFKNSNNGTRFGIVINCPAGFTLSSTLDYVTNSNLTKPISLWNAFATYRFMKQQGELKFSAMDLLKQYQNISNSINTYGTSTRVTNGLQQYFLLTFSYYPRKIGKTELKKQ